MLNFKPIQSKSVWESFLLSSAQVNFLQSWNWGEFHQQLNHQIFRYGFYLNNGLIGVAQLIKIKARRATYLECPGGPIIDWDNSAQVKTVYNHLKNLAISQKASFVRIRPNQLKNPFRLKTLKAAGFRPSPMHLHAETTWVLDLKPPIETILKQMRKNTRYSLKQAEKLKLKVVKSLDDQDIQLLYDLQLEVVKRRHFVPFSKDYLLKQFQTFKIDNQIQLFKVIYQKQVLAIAFIIFYGQEAVYHYSGSSNQLRQIPASYALQWAAIQAAKQKGFNRYNFWGIAPINKPHHRFAGVTLFKTGFGGFEVDYLPAHDLVIRPSYWLNFLIETLRRISRHL
ncbi:MAG: peptidoglycan bridge formation glycyltransferase FemA/FemB family protein [Candidatus Beckwithbacteria bacterium]